MEAVIDVQGSSVAQDSGYQIEEADSLIIPLAILLVGRA
jgi:hypothetical protein